MKRSKIKQMWDALQKAKHLKSRVVAKRLIEMQEVMRPQLLLMQQFLQLPERINEFNIKNMALLKKHALKDEKGEPRTITQGTNVTFLGIDGNEDYLADFTILKEEFKQDLLDFEIKDKEANAWLDEETDIEVKPIPIDALPDTISLAEMEQIAALLK